MESMAETILVIIFVASIILQFVAAYLALRFRWEKAATGGWLLITIALVLMGLRRVSSLSGKLTGVEIFVGLAPEFLALLIYICMVLGIWGLLRSFSLVSDRLAKSKRLTRMAEEHARLYESYVEKSQRLEALRKIDQAIMAERDLGKVLQLILDSAKSLVRARVGQIKLLDPDAAEALMILHSGLQPGECRVLKDRVSIRGVQRRIIDKGVPVLIEDISAEPDSIGLPKGHPRLRELLGVPVKDAQGRVIALVLLSDKEGGEHFTPSDQEIAEAFASQAAIAIQNARLYEDVQRRLEKQQLLGEIAARFSSTLDMSDVLPQVVKGAAKLVAGDAGAVALFDEKKRVITYPYFYNLPEHLTLVTVPEGGGLAGHCMTTRQAVIVDDYPSHPASVKAFVEAGVKSLVAAPIIIGERALGTVGMFFLHEPGHFTEEDADLLRAVANQAAIAIQNARAYEELKALNLQTIEALARAVEAKDPYTAGHSTVVTDHAVAIAERMGLAAEEIETLRMAGLLHDIGKIGIPGSVLNKPSRLTSAEFIMIQSHPVISAEIIGKVKPLTGTVPVIRHHHERYDGTGYPDGLKEEETPLLARILAVADGFEAMTSDRPYRKAFTVEEAIEELKAGAGTRWDPAVVEAFLEILEEESTVDKKPSP
ncbi:MAG: GAF domain-containing protein [Anaerolineae bacterium]